MTLRIMAWNIERFGMGKFTGTKREGKLTGKKYVYNEDGEAAEHIVSTIGQANPDVVVVVEVQTSDRSGFGGLVSDTSGGPATLALLSRMRATQGVARKWMVVPPLLISPREGYAEAISVFFDSKRLTFTGPLQWCGPKKNARPVGGPDAAVSYAKPWDKALPTTASGVGGLKQNQLAGQCTFTGADGVTQVFFPGDRARSLWLTTFADTTSGRTLTLFGVHFPPAAEDAATATKALADVTEITQAIGAAEDRVVVGDFNVNCKVASQLVEAFAKLRATPYDYDVLLDGELSMLKKLHDAGPAGVPPNYYRGYGGWKGHYLGLDNAMVKRGGGAAAATVAVVNRVVGTPAPYTVALESSIPTLLAQTDKNGRPYPVATLQKQFRTLANFGGIRAASDHMALVVELP